MASLTSGNGLSKQFSMGTLGNIGYLGQYSCNSVNLAEMADTVDLTCPKGVFSKIISVGLNKYTGQDICELKDI